MATGQIGVYIDRTYKVVRQDLINRFSEANIDLTPEQWVVLSKLEHKKLSQSDLASQSFKDHPTVSRIIDLLSRKELVDREKDDNDRRRYLIKLTKKGGEMIKRARPHVLASREKGWDNLNQEEYDQLIATLDKIFTNYSR
ncbi:MAG: MarR family transcriptional regulator [Balneolaceae bacterium]|nr:MarR family transcriptional regulator [Balneolaceae bacterium]